MTRGPVDCRYCERPAYTADAHGPVHECCWGWQDVIATGQPCPACKVARVAMARMDENDARAEAGMDLLPVLPRALPPLPRALPDGSPYVPRIRPPGENARPIRTRTEAEAEQEPEASL